MKSIYNKYKRRLSRFIMLLLLPKRSIGAEIGVLKGSFTQHIKRVVRPARLHLIDPWRYVKSPELYFQSQDIYDDVYNEVCARFKSDIDKGVLFVHREFSDKAASEFKDNYFDWVYIDGDHGYEAVLRDLNSYLEKVKAGGLLAGDDYRRSDDPNQGVMKAVDEFIQNGKVRKVFIIGDQYVLRKCEG